MSFDQFLRLSSGSASTGPKQDSFVDGTTHHVTDDGVFFTVDSWDGGKFAFGPSPWSGAKPDVGEPVLVLFEGTGVDTPWVFASNVGGLVDADISPTAAIAYSKLSIANGAIAFSKLAPPTAATPWNSQRITGLADPVNAQDAVTKSWADARYVLKAGDTMTGKLTISVGGAEALRFVTAGAHIGWWDSTQATRQGYIQGNGASGIIINSEAGPLDLRGVSRRINLNGTSLNLGIPTTYGAWYDGLNWGASYIIMTAGGTDTFVSAGSGSAVYIRSGQNGPYELAIKASGSHTMVGHLDLGAYSFAAEQIQAGWTGIWLGASHTLGWYNSGDELWVRSRNDKNIYTGGEIRAGTAFTSPRGGGGWYYERAFQANNNGARVGYSLLAGGAAVNIDQLYASANLNLLNTDSSGYCPVFGGAYTNASQRKLKQNIRPWPAPVMSLGAAADEKSTWQKLRDIDVVSYQIKPEIAMRPAMGERREKALQRLNAAMAAKGADLYPSPSHVCGSNDRNDYDCGHTMEDPCVLYKTWEKGTIGGVAEQVHEVLPEAVTPHPEDGSPGGLDALAVSFAIIRGLQDLPADLPTAIDRIVSLEGALVLVLDRLTALEAA